MIGRWIEGRRRQRADRIALVLSLNVGRRWWVPDLAKLLNMPIAQVYAALARLERRGVAVSGWADRDTCPRRRRYQHVGGAS